MELNCIYLKLFCKTKTLQKVKFTGADASEVFWNLSEKSILQTIKDKILVLKERQN